MKYIAITLAALLAGTAVYGQQAQKNTDFAFRLYSHMKNMQGNIIISPNSISEAMAMVYPGAKSTTKDQIATTMGFDTNLKAHLKNFRNLNKELTSLNNIELFRANSIWVENTYSPKKCFLKNDQKTFGASVYKTDFINSSDQSRQEINKWVEDKTKNRIKNLLPDGSLDGSTRMVLVNSIYFYGEWEKSFDPKMTVSEPFSAPSKEITTKFLHAKEQFLYSKTDGYSMVELPFKGNDVVLLALLPNEPSGMAELEAKLSADFLKQATSELQSVKVDLKLPKIKLETESVRIDGQLADMGMPLAFSSQANFSGISKNNDLKIDKVFHKAFLEFSEKGAEAAAATAVVMVRTAINPANEIRFWANRPFIFFIWDKKHNIILFMGRIETPNA